MPVPGCTCGNCTELITDADHIHFENGVMYWNHWPACNYEARRRYALVGSYLMRLDQEAGKWVETTGAQEGWEPANLEYRPCDLVR
jgi:hypothetical protein